jgi:peptidoglycan/xylan/chitin deacetylase (PgdA/CDA1 family)
MEELAAEWQVVPLGLALEDLAAPARGSGPVVVLTFDDAFLNFRTRAFPILERLGLPATLYVPTGFVEGEIAGPLRGAETLPPMSWEGLRDLASTGIVTLGSHGHSHTDLPLLSPEAVAEELRRSRDLLAERTGVDPEHFAYPRAAGELADDAPVREAYASATLAGGRLNRPGFDRWRISRIPLRRDMPARLAPLLTRTICLEERLATAGRFVRRRLSRNTTGRP